MVTVVSNTKKADERQQNKFGSGEIRTRASEETGALNQRLRPLGHATLLLYGLQEHYKKIAFSQPLSIERIVWYHSETATIAKLKRAPLRVTNEELSRR